MVWSKDSPAGAGGGLWLTPTCQGGLRMAGGGQRPGLGVAVRRVGVVLAGDLGDVAVRGVEQGAADVGVALDEPREAAGGQACHVLPDHDLGVAVRARADADRGNAQ